MLNEQELKDKELCLKAKELDLKSEELALQRRKNIWWSGPLALAVIGGLIAWFAEMGAEIYKASEARNAKTLETALELVKAAAASTDVERTRTNIRFIIDLELAPPDLAGKLRAYLAKPDATLPSGIGAVGLSGALAGLSISSASGGETSRTPPSSQPASLGETGWFYLGKSDDKETNWVESSAIGTFEMVPSDQTGRGIPVSVGQKIEMPLVGKIVRTLSPKYLRDGGIPGQRVQSPVMRTLNPGTVLKIKSIDDQGRDNQLPVLWAEVEVQNQK
ncbi:MAG: hypothetical protein Q8L22_07575 [Reyranella sp.]|nr:hypothetical protein [Reyranella sp.]